MERTTTKSLVPFQPFKPGRNKLRHALTVSQVSDIGPVVLSDELVQVNLPVSGSGASTELGDDADCQAFCQYALFSEVYFELQGKIEWKITWV